MKTISPLAESFAFLLIDHTPCFEIDTSGSASEHRLSELSAEFGFASLTACLNALHGWNLTVSDVARLMIDAID